MGVAFGNMIGLISLRKKKKTAKSCQIFFPELFE